MSGEAVVDRQLLESAVRNWLSAQAAEFVVQDAGFEWADFALKTADSRIIVIEVRVTFPGDGALQYFLQKLRDSRLKSSLEFILVTLHEPSLEDLRRFEIILGASGMPTSWVGVAHLPQLLGKPSPGPLNSPETWSKLQVNALIAGVDSYRNVPIGSGGNELPEQRETASLARQFSYDVISWMTESRPSIESALDLGERQANVTVVLSDLVNFSDLVAASRSEELKDCMSDYYQRARKLVFRHGGMLDKFIGDAVLAVFGYPRKSSDSSARAVHFAADLVRMGGAVLERWQGELNAAIVTGTRVGIATGDIWPINIGSDALEISLLGDTINLAARLEKSCSRDGLLIDNRTYVSAKRSMSSMMVKFGFEEKTIEASRAKGQTQDIRAWATSRPLPELVGSSAQ